TRISWRSKTSPSIVLAWAQGIAGPKARACRSGGTGVGDRLSRRRLAPQAHIAQQRDDVVFHLVQAADGVEEAGKQALETDIVEGADLLGCRLVAAVDVPGR